MGHDINNDKRRMTPNEMTCLFSQYDAAISYIDSSLERLFRAIETRGLYDNTMIILTADHGEAFGEHGSMGHAGISVYQEQTSVPLLIKFPERRSQIIEEPVSEVDLMPTILDAAGIAVPVPVHGESLRMIPSSPPRALFSASYLRNKRIGFDSGLDRVENGVVLGDWKFITSTEGKRELYNLADDRREETNLLARDAVRSIGGKAPRYDWSTGPSAAHDRHGTADDVADELETEFQQWLASVPEFYESGSDRKVDVDESTRERLRALGYLR